MNNQFLKWLISEMEYLDLASKTSSYMNTEFYEALRIKKLIFKDVLNKYHESH
jgi:hypothetical protein